MPPNIASGHVQVKILKDNVAEVDEQFLIEIYRAEVVGMPSGSSPNVRIGAPRVINVTIAANDQPYGLFGIYFKDTGTVGTTYHLIEPETGQSSVTFEIRRSQGGFFCIYQIYLQQILVLSFLSKFSTLLKKFP